LVTCERVGGEGEAVLANQVARVVRSMCSGSEAGLYLRLIDFVYHSTLGVRVIKKKKRWCDLQGGLGTCELVGREGQPESKAHRLLYHSTLGLRVIQKKKRDSPRTRPWSEHVIPNHSQRLVYQGGTCDLSLYKALPWQKPRP